MVHVASQPPRCVFRRQRLFNAVRIGRALMLAAAGVLGLTGLNQQAYSTTGQWKFDGNGMWSFSPYWTSAPFVPNGIDDVAVLGLTTTARRTISLSNTVTLGTLTFDSQYGYDLRSATPGASLIFAVSSGHATIQSDHTNGPSSQLIAAPLVCTSPLSIINNNVPVVTPTGSGGTITYYNHISLSGSISGSGAITVAGLGVTVLSGNNANWAGQMTINNGTLLVSGSNALGTGSGAESDATMVNSGGILAIYSGITLVREKIILRGGTLSIPTNSIPSMTTLQGPLVVAADSFLHNLPIYATTGFFTPTLALQGNLSGSANLAMQGGQFTLSAQNSFSGKLDIQEGTVSLTSTGSLLGATLISVGGNGRFSISRPAGVDPTLNSVAPHSIVLAGGTLILTADLDPESLFHATSSGGNLAINATNYTGGNTKTLDMNRLPTGLRLGSSSSGSLPPCPPTAPSA